MSPVDQTDRRWNGLGPEAVALFIQIQGYQVHFQGNSTHRTTEIIKSECKGFSCPQLGMGIEGNFFDQSVSRQIQGPLLNGELVNSSHLLIVQNLPRPKWTIM